jgi:hypothetical protein
VLKRKAPTVESVREMMEGDGKVGKGKGKGKGQDKWKDKGKVVDDYNARAVRHSLRVFVATGALMKAYGVLMGRLGKKNE